VLGLTAADFGFAAAAAPVGLASLSYGSSQAQGSASVSVVLDSSSSMGALVGTTGKSRYQVAALAAHELLNGLQTGADEANVTIFSSRIFPMNDTTLAALNWVDTAGLAIPDYTFSATGKTQTIAALRPVIDAYNPRSQIYRSNATSTTADAVHPDTGNRRISSSYPYSGATAFYDGTITGINALTGALNPRKIVVSMTDGQENASVATLPTVISTAKAQNVPVFTVAFGAASQVDEADMQAIADQTGGQYRRVEGLDLAGLFQGIQTGIRFQYVATLGAVQASGTVLTITLTRGGTPVTRTITIQ
jgi:von Willebrand factor type A domain